MEKNRRAGVSRSLRRNFLLPFRRTRPREGETFWHDPPPGIQVENPPGSKFRVRNHSKKKTFDTKEKKTFKTGKNAQNPPGHFSQLNCTRNAPLNSLKLDIAKVRDGSLSLSLLVCLYVRQSHSELKLHISGSPLDNNRWRVIAR